MADQSGFLFGFSGCTKIFDMSKNFDSGQYVWKSPTGCAAVADPESLGVLFFLLLQYV